MEKLMEQRYQKQEELAKLKINLFKRQLDFSKTGDQDTPAQDNRTLTVREKNRWDRQIKNELLNQKKIKNAKIACFGLGGIGSNALLGLIYSGVELFKIIDYDTIETSNLNRQTLYEMKDIGQFKAKAAKLRMLQINPEISVDAFNIFIDYPRHLNILKKYTKEHNENCQDIEKIIAWADYIINAVDYNGAPYLINDFCVRLQKPYYWAGVNHFIGDIFPYIPKKAPCLRCIFNSDFYSDLHLPFLRYRTDDTSHSTPNLGTTVISTGTIISELIIHDICKIYNPLKEKYLIYDSLNLELHKIPLQQDQYCHCQKFIEKEKENFIL
ncbi:MAG: HesA/MoeB/ThiF family protein [Promethearchaeia archaeon]